jgi:type I restriction enzyme R subunit
VVDECHRGSAAEDSAWRDILSYFSSATQVGLTATPKETKDVSNIDYFGEPVYTYSLRQGIEDGYLAPYKVIRVDLDKDTFGWRPTAGMTDKHGHLIEDRIYNGTDMNRSLVLEQRDAVVAEQDHRIPQGHRPLRQDHRVLRRHRPRRPHAPGAEQRQRRPLRHPAQIRGADHRRQPRGQARARQLHRPRKAYPVIATTSKLMSTGVDAQTCKLIVLDQNIKSMTLFKQIIGRGTRLREDLGKTWFTILDFKRATELFADKDFDGDPVQIYEPKGDDPIAPPEPDDPAQPVSPEFGDGQPADPLGPLDPLAGTDGANKPKKYVVGGLVTVAVARERVQYLNAQGKLITESLRDYTRINLTRRFDSLDRFLQAWSDADRKAALLAELEGQGVLIDALADEVGRDLDPFDLLLHVAYEHATAHPARARPPRTHQQRLHPVRPGGPQGAGRAARQIRRRRPGHHRGRQRAQHPALHRAGQPGGAGAQLRWPAAVPAGRAHTGAGAVQAGIRPPRRLSGVKNTQLFIAEYDHSTLGSGHFCS